jgi:hypothetical protein
LGSYVNSHFLAVAPQLGAKEKKITFCYITLKSNREAQRASENFLKKMYKMHK